MQPRLCPTKKVLADELVKGKLPRRNGRPFGIGHRQRVGLEACGADLCREPVKPVAVRIAFKTVYDKDASGHVDYSFSDDLQFTYYNTHRLFQFYRYLW